MSDHRVNDVERHVTEHATAWTHRHRLYRNYFVAGPDHEDWPVLQALCARGLVQMVRGQSATFGGDAVFSVTPAGIAALGEGDA